MTTSVVPYGNSYAHVMEHRAAELWHCAALLLPVGREANVPSPASVGLCETSARRPQPKIVISFRAGMVLDRAEVAVFWLMLSPKDAVVCAQMSSHR